MLFSEAKGRPVIATDTATTIGTVDGFVVDPGAARVVAVRLTNAASGRAHLHWDDLTAFGVDNVTVTSVDAVGPPRAKAAQIAASASDVLGKRLLTDAGDDIGTVADVEFDAATGSVVALVTGHGQVYEGRLLGCGSHAVVVKGG